ncbi:hypothetical protein OB955_08310 [Halobacteria archaeon AArc-m2/3/4]|uniref:Uncharacterized protein n=1 Tax=Natronoglomus mannanivorans TaxID=2979990 RepID=A0ABT2QCT9_9EURY|nr:hypothetical protein [Halobacteria archaeon AArc-m2/3/4]
MRRAAQLSMFSLWKTFERDRFQSILVFGTQISSARSRYELRKFLGEPWLYRLFTPDTIREATVCSGWNVVDVNRGTGDGDGDGDGAHHYRLALRKC